VAMPEFQLGYDYEVAEEADSANHSEEDSDPDIIKANHRKSMILMEQSLMIPCDVSPLSPANLCKQEEYSDGSSLEKLMFERLLLRKELRLRTMQERLLDQETKLEVQEKRIKELEVELANQNSVPDVFTALFNLSASCVSAGKYSVEVLRSRAGLLLTYLNQVFGVIACMIPPSLSLGIAALIHWFGTLIAQRAENFTNESNERAERAQQERTTSSRNNSNSSRGSNNRRRRR